MFAIDIPILHLFFSVENDESSFFLFFFLECIIHIVSRVSDHMTKLTQADDGERKE